MISAFLASLLLAPAAQAPPPGEYGAEASEAANGYDEVTSGTEDAVEAAADAAEAAADQAEAAADAAGQATERAAEAATEAHDEGDGGQVCTRRQSNDMLGRARTRKVCRPR